MVTNETLLCSICFKPIPPKHEWKYGNNAAPVNEGRCCDKCNERVVIPARINLFSLKPEVARQVIARHKSVAGAGESSSSKDDVNTKPAAAESAPALEPNEPVAWRTYNTDGSEAVYSLYEQARAAADERNWKVEPLYRKPEPASV